MPHPVHIHANNLGVAGNADTTLDTMRTLSGRQAHFAHLQFHSYGGKPGGQPRSRAPELIEYLGDHPELTADVGQVMFGPAMTMTADAPVSAVLRDLDGGKWINHDTEVETGCGIVPYRYRAGNYVHALQWAIGLELFLLGQEPWQVMLSTDHPNGGSFLSYPKLIRLLMDRAFREDQMGRANQRAIRRTALPDGLDREYTLNEIAIITRAAPARRLGLRDKGHLGVGADADVTIYHDRADREEMFATPRYVIKGGEVAVEDGELRRVDDGVLLSSRAGFDPEVSRVLEPLFGDRYTVAFEHYPVRDPALREPARVVEARSAMTGYTLGNAEVADTFAEAFPMRFARLVITAGHRRLGARGGALDDRLRHLGDRLQVRGGDRAPGGRGGDARRPPGHRRAAVRDGPRGGRQARARARRPERDDVPDDRVLRRASRGRAGPCRWARACATSATAFRPAR